MSDHRAEAVDAMCGYAADAELYFRIVDGEPLTSQDVDTLDKCGVLYDMTRDQVVGAGIGEVFDAVVGLLSLETMPDDDQPWVTWARAIYCTGGPHYELRWRVGDPLGPVFVSLPWFDRVELGSVPVALRRLAAELDELVERPSAG